MKNVKKEIVKLTVNQDMTIINVVGLKEKFEKALNSASTIELTIKNAHVIDLAGLQLIYALKKEADKKNKELKINFELEEKLLRAINMSGFGDLFKN